MAPKLIEKKRKPLGTREVHIIRRLKKVVKLPVTTIALVCVCVRVVVVGRGRVVCVCVCVCVCMCAWP